VVVIACLLVNLLTFSGVALMGGWSVYTSTTASEHRPLAHWITGGINGFAAGALLGSAAFLMLLESSHLVEEEWAGDENDVAWRWGFALLAGFLFPLVGQIVSEAAGLDLAAFLKGGEDSPAQASASHPVSNLGRARHKPAILTSLEILLQSSRLRQRRTATAPCLRYALGTSSTTSPTAFSLARLLSSALTRLAGRSQEHPQHTRL